MDAKHLLIASRISTLDMFESLPSVYAFPAQSQLFCAVRRAEAAQTDRRTENQVESPTTGLQRSVFASNCDQLEKCDDTWDLVKTGSLCCKAFPDFLTPQNNSLTNSQTCNQ